MFVHFLDETESTNDVARSMAAAGAPHGTVVHAARQTRGRGRRQRVWWSPDEGALMMSVILRPRGAIDRVASLSLEIGVAVVEALGAIGVAAKVKWPNDIFVGRRKLAGVLCELADDDRGRWSIVVGVGLNCNIEAEAFPDEIGGSATSVLGETLHPVDVGALVRSIATSILQRFGRFDAVGLDVEAVNAASNTTGARVRGEDGREGTAETIAPSGALLVRWDGAAVPTEVVAGDIVRVVDLAR